jgi:hypothetical protein
LRFEAKKCRFCGEFLDGRTKVSEDFYRSIGIIGSVALVIAPFAPFVSSPVGPATIFMIQGLVGYGLLGVALLAIGLCLCGHRGILFVSGTLGVIATAMMLQFCISVLPGRIDEYRAIAMIPAGSMAGVEPDYGAAVILIGIVLSFTASLSGSKHDAG